MSNEVAINVQNATVRFNLSTQKVDSLKEYFIRMVKRQLMFQEFFALKNVSFEVKRGESWGIVGDNGSGKSTLLKLICGIFKPFAGTVEINGRIAPLIELGAGFDFELTARENIFLNGAVLGHSKKFMQEHYNEIAAFSELHDFMDVPLKNYSSGMAARLGFAIATMVHPDILIVDEILSVGDYAFRKKCEQRMMDMLQGGTTLLYVSHSVQLVQDLCKSAIWLSKGNVMMTGESKTVCDAYIKAIS